MQKLIRVKDDKDLIALRMLMDDGWYIVDSNVMQFVTTTLPAKTPVAKTYGGYIDYILSDGNDNAICDACHYRKMVEETYTNTIPNESTTIWINGHEALTT